MNQKETIKFLEQRKREILQQAQKEIDALDTTIHILSRAGSSSSSDVETITRAVKAVEKVKAKGKRGRKKGSVNKPKVTTTAASSTGAKRGRPAKAKPAASTAPKGRRGRKPAAGTESLVDTVLTAISGEQKFVKASTIYSKLQKQFPDRKGPQFKVQLSSVLNGLSKKGRIKLNKYGNSNKDTAWGLPEWLDDKGNVKAERAL